MKFKKTRLYRYIRLFVAGLAVLLVVEMGVLIFAGSSLQQSTEGIQVQDITNDVSSVDKLYKQNLDSGATDIRASYDGNYVAYKLNGKLNILDMKSGKSYQINMASGLKLSYYKWVYDRDQMIIAELSDNSYDYYVKLYNLNAATLDTDSTPNEILSNANSANIHSVKVTWPYTTGWRVTGLDFSTSTVIAYIKMTDQYSKNKLYIFNLPEDYHTYDISPTNIGGMQCLKNINNLMYEDKDNGKVNVATYNCLTVNGETEFHLLGFDSDDDVFLGRGSGDKTKEVWYGSIIDYSSGKSVVNVNPKMKSIKPGITMNVSDIHVCLDGNVYYNDSENKTFENLKTKKKVSYTGDVIAVYDEGFITLDNGKASQNSFQ